MIPEARLTAEARVARPSESGPRLFYFLSRAHCERATRVRVRLMAVRFARRFVLRITKNRATTRQIAVGTLNA